MKSTNKIIIVMLSCICSIQLSFSQKVDYRSLISGGGKKSDCSNAIAVDNEENVYFAGYFNETNNFGKNTITSYGGSDIFITKYNRNGECVWIKQAGSAFFQKNTITDAATSIAIVNDQYIYITGSFSGEAVFDSIKIVSSGLQDIFIAKYDTDGNLIWVKGGGGINQDLSYDITVDDKGNAYITGSFQNEAIFNNVAVRSENGTDVFIAKYDKEGTLVWLKQTKSNDCSIGKALIYSNGCIYVSGAFSKKMIFQNQEITSNGLDDIFLICLEDNGQIRWLKGVGGAQSEEISSISTNAENLYFTGSFVGETRYNNTIIESNGGRDILLGCITKEGEFNWMKNFGGCLFDKGNSISFDDEGNVILLGTYHDEFKEKGTRLKSIGYSDIVLANISNHGALNWAVGFGSIGQEKPIDIFFMKDKYYVTGSFMNQLLCLGEIAPSNGRSDFFLYTLSINEVEPIKPERFSLLLSEQDADNIKIFPMPANDYVFVESSESINNMEIVTIEGKVIKQFNNIDAKNYKVDISYLPVGNYILVISLKGKTNYKRLIKNRA